MNRMDNQKIDFLYLSEKDMIKSGVTDMVGCMDAMEEVLRCMSAGDFVMGGENHTSHGCMVTFPIESSFPNMPTNTGEDRRFMAMPAYIGGHFDIAGMKWYGSNTANREVGLPRSILMLMLNDKNTGAPISLMSANLISAYRTGAIPGVGARYLARKESKVCGVYGPGVMGKTGLEAILSACPRICELKIKGRGKRSIDNFVTYVEEHFPQITKIEVVDSIEGLVRDSDVVLFSATAGNDPAKYAYVKGEWIKPGALLVGSSAFDVETEFLAKKCRLVVDCMGLYQAWAEEYPYPTFGPINIVGSKFTDMVHEKHITEKEISDLGDILLGKTKGRRDENEIIVFSVGGMPVEDVAWGKICYERARKEDLGIQLNLWDTPYLA